MRMLSKLSLFLFLIFFAAACDVVSNSEDHTEAEGFAIYQDGKETLRYFDGKIETGSKITVSKGSSTNLEVKWLNADKDILTTEEGASLHFKSVNTAIATATASGTWGIQLQGVTAGTTGLEIGLLHEGHFDFAAREIPVEVK